MVSVFKTSSRDQYLSPAVDAVQSCEGSLGYARQGLSSLEQDQSLTFLNL